MERGAASFQMHSAATRFPEQHLRDADPYGPAAAVRSPQRLKKEQLFTSDFRNQGNRVTSLQLKVGKFT